jgi:hypothetical protein
VLRGGGSGRTKQRFALAQRDKKAGAHPALFDDALRAAVLAQIVVTHDVFAGGYVLQRRRRDRVPLQLRNELVRQSTLGARPETRSVIDPKDAGGGLAEPSRLFQHRIPHRREIAWRRIDDAEDLGGRGLLRQGFVTLGSAFS